MSSRDVTSGVDAEVRPGRTAMVRGFTGSIVRRGDVLRLHTRSLVILIRWSFKVHVALDAEMTLNE